MKCVHLGTYSEANYLGPVKSTTSIPIYLHYNLIGLLHNHWFLIEEVQLVQKSYVQSNQVSE